MASSDHIYIGSELELFQSATNWKQYFSEVLTPFLGDEVLEVGAGIGGTTAILCQGEQKRWLCLEPDPALCHEIERLIAAGVLPACCETHVGSLTGEVPVHRFDTILYIDVLEHIEDDVAEIERAMARLKPGGHLVVLAPAHTWLFSPFDEAVGHFRRYTRASLLERAPAGLKPVQCRYLDACGTALSLANKLLLRRSSPSVANINFWDRFVVPVSRFVDRLLGYRLGKTVVVVWQRV
jgi:SAM-dependent methyltransferase